MRSTVSRPEGAGRPAQSRGFDGARETPTAAHASYLLAKGGSDHLIAACVSAAAGLSEFQPTDLRPNVGNRTATFTRHPRSNDSDYSLPRRGGSVGGAIALRQEWPRARLGAQLGFKDSMIRGILQFTLRIAFRCVLHRCKSQDIRC